MNECYTDHDLMSENISVQITPMDTGYLSDCQLVARVVSQGSFLDLATCLANFEILMFEAPRNQVQGLFDTPKGLK